MIEGKPRTAASQSRQALMRAGAPSLADEPGGRRGHDRVDVRGRVEVERPQDLPVDVVGRERGRVDRDLGLVEAGRPKAADLFGGEPGRGDAQEVVVLQARRREDLAAAAAAGP